MKVHVNPKLTGVPPWKHHGSTMEAPWKHHLGIVTAQWNRHDRRIRRRTMEAPWKHHGNTGVHTCINPITSMAFPWKEAPWKSHVGTMETLLEYHRSTESPESNTTMEAPWKRHHSSPVGVPYVGVRPFFRGASMVATVGLLWCFHSVSVLLP